MAGHKINSLPCSHQTVVLHLTESFLASLFSSHPTNDIWKITALFLESEKQSGAQLYLYACDLEVFIGLRNYLASLSTATQTCNPTLFQACHLLWPPAQCCAQAPFQFCDLPWPVSFGMVHSVIAVKVLKLTCLNYPPLERESLVCCGVHVCVCMCCGVCVCVASMLCVCVCVCVCVCTCTWMCASAGEYVWPLGVWANVWQT